MKISNLARTAVTVGAFLACAAPAQAVDLIGETLTFRRLYPDFNTDYGPPFEPKTVTVVAGDGDSASWIVGSTVYLQALPEATTITFVIPVPSGYGNGNNGQFDGYSISGFSFSTAAVSVGSNTSGLQVQLSSVGDTLYIGLANTSSGQIVLDFTSAVPEPGTWALFGAGLLAIGRFARRPRPVKPTHA